MAKATPSRRNSAESMEERKDKIPIPNNRLTTTDIMTAIGTIFPTNSIDKIICDGTELEAFSEDLFKIHFDKSTKKNRNCPQCGLRFSSYPKARFFRHCKTIEEEVCIGCGLKNIFVKDKFRIFYSGVESERGLLLSYDKPVKASLLRPSHSGKYTTFKYAKNKKKYKKRKKKVKQQRR